MTSLMGFLQKVDVMGKLVDELMARTHELLQPNPGTWSVSMLAVRSPPFLAVRESNGRRAAWLCRPWGIVVRSGVMWGRSQPLKDLSASCPASSESI